MPKNGNGLFRHVPATDPKEYICKIDVTFSAGERISRKNEELFMRDLQRPSNSQDRLRVHQKKRVPHVCKTLKLSACAADIDI